MGMIEVMIDSLAPAGVGAPCYLSDSAKVTWDQLGQPSPTTVAHFDPTTIGHLPTPVVRWLNHAIEPGAPLHPTAHFGSHGEIRIGRRLGFRADQLLGPAGYLWAAQAGHFPMRISGCDRFTESAADMQWRLLGVPVMTESGSDIARSAAGRFASETIGLLPGGALTEGVVWSGVDSRRAVAHLVAGGFAHAVTIVVDDLGALRSVSLPRWGDPDHRGFRDQPFGARFAEERRFDGHLVPTKMRAGWRFGTDRWDDGAFFRATIDAVDFP
jgi:hypothetical protein